MADKRPRGRPATGNARTNPVNLRLNDEEHAAIEQARGNTPMSTWIRDEAVSAAKKANRG